MIRLKDRASTCDNSKGLAVIKGNDVNFRISTPEIQNMYQDALTIIPEYFYRVPASSTGKYHPSFCLGEGGLVRHTQFALDIAKELFNIYTFTIVEQDIILVSVALHDTFKLGSTENKRTDKLHPLIASDEYKKYWSSKNYNEKYISQITKAISTHMGKWNEDNKLPSPINTIEKFVHLCDYLASRKVYDTYYSEKKV